MFSKVVHAVDPDLRLSNIKRTKTFSLPCMIFPRVKNVSLFLEFFWSSFGDCWNSVDNQLTDNYFLSYFSAQCPKSYRHNADGSNLDFITLKGTKPRILTLERYDDHPRHFYMGFPSGSLVDCMTFVTALLSLIYM